MHRSLHDLFPDHHVAVYRAALAFLHLMQVKAQLRAARWDIGVAGMY